MRDGPIDYGSGYFFEGQKGISDRRAARGLDQGPHRSAGVGSSKASSSGGSTIADIAMKVVGFLLVATIVIVAFASVAAVIVGG